MYSKVIQLHIYMCVCVCVCVFISYSFYHRTLNIVPCGIQYDLIVYPSYIY